MSKHRKQDSKDTRHQAPAKAPSAGGTAVLTAANPPARHPTLLAVSIALFTLWFIFLLVTALTG